jgi:protein phosphatase 1 regulatory subunit 37
VYVADLLLPSLVTSAALQRADANRALAQGVRTSEIKNISLRRNRVNAPGGVALALLVKDYPEVASTGASNPFSQSSVASSTLTSPSATSPSSPYTAYTPRSRRANIETINAASTELPSIPQLTTNGGGGITSRTVPSGYVGKGEGEEDSDEDDDDAYLRSRRDPLKGDGDGPGVAESLQNSLMQSRVRSLDDVERIGKLVTLDLKGNDLRVRFPSFPRADGARFADCPILQTMCRVESLTSPRSSSGTERSRS